MVLCALAEEAAERLEEVDADRDDDAEAEADEADDEADDEAEADALDSLMLADMDMDMLALLIEALALEAEAEADAEALAAVEAAIAAVLVAPWTWKPPEKLYSLGLESSMIWMKTSPVGTSGGIWKVVLPVLGMFSATMMPSVGWMSPLVWILMVTVLEGEEGG